MVSRPLSVVDQSYSPEGLPEQQMVRKEVGGGGDVDDDG